MELFFNNKLQWEGEAAVATPSKYKQKGKKGENLLDSFDDEILENQLF